MRPKSRDEINDLLNKELDKRGWTRYHLAKIAGINRAVFTKFNDGANFSPSTLVKLSQTLGVSFFDEEQKTDDMVYIPSYNIAFGGGDAYEPTYEELSDVRQVGYCRSFFDALNVDPRYCKRFRVKGDSMEPLILDGDSILVDTSATSIIDNHIYIFVLDGMLRVKRLQKMLNKTLKIISENPDYSTEEIPLEELQDNFVLLGEVLERTGLIR
ncbi:DNA polymerase V subunit UmuD [Anaerobiospirillum thomasii]|uniref:LexA family transcriptional regulator n=1 Tax=Anaerobiospirillum thomasii TaxID=179995 RepID=UPI000D92392A|nr:LexA family transcriptional regulator [Anaerobiospirillum thomasii]SPT71554.1 DNA polymerase V subunit UmuD [Anaerobiospirillum thomasii]